MTQKSIGDFFIKILRAVFYVALFFGMQIAATIVYMIVLGLFGIVDTEALLSSDGLIAITIFANVFTVIAIFMIQLGFHATGKRDLFTELKLCRFGVRAIAPIVICAIASCVFFLLAIDTIPFPKEWIDAYNESSSSVTGGNVITVLMLATVVAPITEEFTFRAMTYGHLSRAMNKYLAAAIVSACFGIAHGTIIWAIYASLLGFIINLIFIRTDSIFAPILFHVVFNIFGLFCGALTLLGATVKLVILVSAFAVAAISFFAIYRATKVAGAVSPTATVDASKSN